MVVIKRIRLKQWVLAAIVLCSSPFSHSQNILEIFNLSLEDLSNVEISIATGNNTPIQKAPATASVISAAEIQSMGARTLDDVIEKIPGVHVSISPFNRLDRIYSFRGIHTGFNPHVLLMVNNVPVQFSLQGGRPSLFRMPLQYVERIEVIRGPGSAIYGADAYSGVINVITKHTDQLEANEGGVRLGSFGFRDFWVQGGKKFSSVDASFNLNVQSSDGDDSRTVDSDLQSILDGLLMTDASLAPGQIESRYDIIDAHLSISAEKWQGNFWTYISHDAGVGVGGASALDPKGHDDSHMYLADFRYTEDSLVDGWEFTTHASYMYYDLQAQFNLLPAGTTVPIGPDGNLNQTAPAGFVTFTEGLIGNPGVETTDAQLDQVALFTGLDNHAIRLAIGTRYQGLEGRERKNFGPSVIDGTQPIVDGSLTNVSDTDFMFVRNTSRTTKYISLQDQWAIANNFELTSGVRADHYSDFGSTINPRIALVNSQSKLTTKVMYGTAFRAPSFSEQFNRNNPAVIGNDDLDPETIDTLEVSFNYKVSQSLNSTINFFQYEAKDLIEAIPDEGEPTSTTQNARDQEGRGYEIEVDWKPMDTLHVSSSFSWQQARDDATDDPIAYIPQRQFTTNVYWQLYEKWFINSQLNWVGDRERTQTDTRSLISNYTLIDLNIIRKDVVKNLDMGLMIRNLADRDAREPSEPGAPGLIEFPNDFPLESRSVTFEIRYDF